MSHVHTTLATVNLFTITLNEYSRYGVGHNKENCRKISATYRSRHACNRAEWQCGMCSVYSEPTSMVTSGKVLKHKQNVCIHK